MRRHLREARLAHGRVRFVERGDGPALLLIHGLGGNWQNWLANIPRLAREHRVIAVDLPGFGRSDALRGGVSMARYADVLVELLDARGVERATFAGNSMGGLLAIEAAVRHPGRVAGAVLVCSGGIPLSTLRHRLVLIPAGSALNLALRHTRLRRLLLSNRGLRHAIAGTIVHDAAAIDDHHLVRALDGLGAAGFQAAKRAALRYDAHARAPLLSCPTLILWGREDPLLPLWMGERLHALIAHSQFVVWDDTGHCPMLERPARFDALLAAFVAGRSAIEAPPSGG